MRRASVVIVALALVAAACVSGETSTSSTTSVVTPQSSTTEATVSSSTATTEEVATTTSTSTTTTTEAKVEPKVEIVATNGYVGEFGGFSGVVTLSLQNGLQGGPVMADLVMRFYRGDQVSDLEDVRTYLYQGLNYIAADSFEEADRVDVVVKDLEPVRGKLTSNLVVTKGPPPSANDLFGEQHWFVEGPVTSTIAENDFDIFYVFTRVQLVFIVDGEPLYTQWEIEDPVYSGGTLDVLVDITENSDAPPAERAIAVVYPD